MALDLPLHLALDGSFKVHEIQAKHLPEGLLAIACRAHGLLPVGK